MSTTTPPAGAGLDDCFQSIQELCNVRGVMVVRVPETTDNWVRFKVAAPEECWELAVDCTWPCYSTLPTVQLMAPLTRLAHVSYGGGICINDAQGLSVDIDRHADVVAHSVGLALDLLEKSLQDANADQAEFNNELEGYWFGLPESSECHATFNVDSSSRLLSVHLQADEKQWWVTEKDAPLPKELLSKNADKSRAIYLVLPLPPTPPAPGKSIGDAFFDDLVSKFTQEQLALWQSLLGPSMNGRKQVSVFIASPRPAGGQSVIGLSFIAYKRKRVPGSPLKTLYVRRHNAAYMRERGGALNELATKHVVVFGAGSVGSEVIDALATSGVGKLTIVDYDRLSEDNVFRHVMGTRYVGLSKAISMSLLMEDRYPGLQAQFHFESAQKWLSKNDLTGFDAVVLALGAPSVERMLMRRMRRKKQAVPVVLTWLEALDLGSHAVAVKSRGEGCLECIYRNDEGHPDLYPRTTFLGRGQTVTRNLTGCTSSFVPYGAIQSRKAALLAAELIIESMLGLQLPAYRFWKSSGITARQQGLATTSWWQLSATTSDEQATEMVFGRPCRHCRGTA